MEPADLGRIRIDATVENFFDLCDARQGVKAPEQVRRVIVRDALLDNGSTTLALPTRLIHQLGLYKSHERIATSKRCVGPVSVYSAVQVTLLDRFCTVDVVELPDDALPLIGEIPLTMLDLVIDVQGRRLMGNPAHGGEQILELYCDYSRTARSAEQRGDRPSFAQAD